MDSVTKIKLDKKFYELSRLNTLSSLLATPALELINDSSIINDDLLLLIEKIQNEGSLLDNFRDEFEVATNKIKIKLGDGGEKLSLDERQLLLQLIMNLKELLRKNEERFYRNNKYYRDEIENLQNQLSNIIDLEDKLIESEEAQKKFKQQLIYISLTLAALIGFAFLLIYLLRIFISQRNELMSANNEIEAINNNLAGIVDEKTKSMEQINKELDTFIYKSSHNLRRPITSIKGLANLAKLTLNNEGIMLFEKVTDVSNDMEKMIDKLSMMNFINQPTGYNRIDFEQLIQKIEKHYSEQIKGSNILFKWDIKLAHDFKSYPSVVELIVQNLVENAFFYCQYTNKKQPAVEICIDLDPSEKNLILSVQDNGCGIDPEYQEKVWNMFFVANIASKGNGLGLYITKKAVESLKGTITLDTKVGTYCNFDIVLPLDYADSEDSLIS
jgi:signal transduction histidine kinase